MTPNRRASKKQHRENESVKSADETPAPNVSFDEQETQTPSEFKDEPTHPLMAEVETFLSKRDELARKLAEEIEATEKKLAELRKIAASLFPENVSSGPTDKKAKKLKTKTSNREAKPESSNSSESPTSSDSTN
jgi:hypothetical protein